MLMSFRVLLLLFVLFSLDNLRALYMHILEFENLVHAYVIFCRCLNYVYVDILKEGSMMVQCNVFVGFVK